MKSSGVGGQAVMEGVMMKHQNQYAVAVRKPDKDIEIKVEEFKSVLPWKGVAKIPLIRGVVSFLDSMILGFGTLTYSASFFEEDEKRQLDIDEKKKKVNEKKDKIIMGITMAFSVIIAVALFMLLPYAIVHFIEPYVKSNIWTGILEGVIRLGLFIGYVYAISFLEDIQRVYMYHGAEHKCINCIEHGLELTVENVRISSKEHKRCGTSFLLFVMITSIIFFMFIHVDSFVARLGLRLALLPAIAGVSYEIIRFAGSSDHILVQILSRPGMWLQGLTTKEPDDTMIEVGIASVEAVYDWKEYLSENYGWKEKNDVD